MDRRSFLQLAAGSPLAGAQARRVQPNVVLILADDLGYGDIGCYGGTAARTPHLDALAGRGIRFTDFHSNGAMCSPTRAALLTGQYQQRCGIEEVLSEKDDWEGGLDLKHVTFAEVLREAGYSTGMFGKWHLGYTPALGPTRQGFSRYQGFMGGCLDYHSHLNRSGRPDWWDQERQIQEKGYTTELLADHASRFIEQNRTRPFCLYVPFQGVHFPFQGPRDKADRALGGDYWSDAKYGSRPDRRAAFAEMVESLDAAVGRILSTLKTQGLERETFVFFTSDNGGFDMVSSNRPLRGAKGQLWEGGHRVPAIASWPGHLAAGAVKPGTALTMDVFPTMAALAGANRLPRLDGVNLLPWMKGTHDLPARTLFWRNRRARAARKQEWKLVIEGERRFLFNLARDIGEQRDLASSEPHRVRQLDAELAVWEKDLPAISRG
jgi:arylsulfatase A-like enzyme